MATIGELLDQHVTLEVECIDRLYLNGYVEKLATGCQLKIFLNQHLKKPFASPVLLGQITQDFVRRLKQYAEQHDIPIIEFKHGQDKDEIANRIRRQRKVRDAVVFIGVAQERAMAFSSKKVNGEFEFNRDKPVYVNHYYGYLDDQEFGPGFLKICSYAPWGIRLCFNGHAWAKRQLDRQGIAFEALDNGFRWCSDTPKRQQICHELGPIQIEQMFRQWLDRLPLPLQAKDRQAGYDYQLSIWQMEVSLTQIFDRPVPGGSFSRK